MALLGLPIVNDRIYPVLYPELPLGAAPDFNQPLKLLAKSIAFTDPVTGERRTFESKRCLNFLNAVPDPETASLPPATTSEDKDLRYLHLGTCWIQGAMHLAKPDAIALEYVQHMMIWMLFEAAPKHIVQLGLGFRCADQILPSSFFGNARHGCRAESLGD